MGYKCPHCKKELNLFECEVWCDCKPRVKQKMEYEPNKEELREEMKLNMENQK